MGILIAPTEPKRLHSLGIVSSVPESMGADIMWNSDQLNGIVGVQRKEISDLVASVHDGRLAKEMNQLSRVTYGALIVEGKIRWTNEGALVSQWTTWSRQAHRSLMRSVMSRGFEVLHTDNVTDTIEALLDMRTYLERPEHNTLNRRPKPKGAWGSPTEKDFASHVIQSAPGVGPKIAEAIYEHFGRVPIGWTCSYKELLEIDGIGKATADRLWKTFGGAATDE